MDLSINQWIEYKLYLFFDPKVLFFLWLVSHNRSLCFIFTWGMFQSHELRRGSNLTNKECLERTRGVVPSHSFSVPVPQLQTMLLFSVFILKIIRFSCVPVLVSDWFSRGHPEELALLCLVGATGPEVFVSHPWIVQGVRQCARLYSP